MVALSTDRVAAVRSARVMEIWFSAPVLEPTWNDMVALVFSRFLPFSWVLLAIRVSSSDIDANSLFSALRSSSLFDELLA
ncbi:hypothetical protein D3C79_1068600 [compost metagenome]